MGDTYGGIPTDARPMCSLCGGTGKELVEWRCSFDHAGEIAWEKKEYRPCVMCSTTRATPDPLRAKLAELCEMWEAMAEQGVSTAEGELVRAMMRGHARQLRELLK